MGVERICFTHHRVTPSPQKRKGSRVGYWAWLKFQPAYEMRTVCVPVSQTQGQCIPSISLDLPHVLFLSAFSCSFKQNHPNLSAFLHVPWPERQKAQGFHQSGIKSTELLPWRSTTDRERDFCREKEEKFKPGQKWCFHSSDPSLVIPGCLKSMKVQLCNYCLREALQRPQINSLAVQVAPGGNKHVEEMYSAKAVGVSQLPKPYQCQSSAVWSARLHPWAVGEGWMCSQVSHPTHWQMFVMCGTSPV